MKVLVTGNLGYIGSVLVPLLEQAGHDVTGLDIGLYADEVLGPVPPSVAQLNLDIRDVEANDLKGFDAVVHLAGISNDPVGDLNPQLTLDINYEASVRLAESAKAAGVSRFLFASSCSLYGSASPRDLLTEQAAFDPVTPYGASKVMVEQELSSLADDEFCPTYLRCATAYGFSPRLRADLAINNLVGHAFLDGKVLMKSDGSPWRPFAHVEDISRAYISILNADRNLIRDVAFNVGRTSENYQIRDVAEIIQDVVQDCVVELASGAEPDARCYRVDCTKLEATLPEYDPQWTVRAGVEQLYDAYRDFHLSNIRFHGAAFTRIKKIQELQLAGRLDSELRVQESQVGVVTS